MGEERKRHNAIGSTIMALVIAVAVGVVAWEHFPNLFGQDDVTVQETPTQTTRGTQYEESNGKAINNVDVLGSDTVADSGGNEPLLAVDSRPVSVGNDALAVASTAVPEVAEPPGYCDIIMVGPSTGYATAPSVENTVRLHPEVCIQLILGAMKAVELGFIPEEMVQLPPADL